jgi:hypothetical protein
LESVIIEDYEGTSHISLFCPCSHLFLGDILFEKESSKTETLQKEMVHLRVSTTTRKITAAKSNVKMLYGVQSLLRWEG